MPLYTQSFERQVHTQNCINAVTSQVQLKVIECNFKNIITLLCFLSFTLTGSLSFVCLWRVYMLITKNGGSVHEIIKDVFFTQSIQHIR